MDKELIKKIKNDFKPISKKTLGILLYGSYAKGDYNSRSDIDICIVAPNKDPYELFKETLSLKYDIKIFETMPFFLKIEVIKNHEIILSKDPYELYEYFYKYRKIWNDQKQRQVVSKMEALHLFSKTNANIISQR